jgi:hypothetical protein
VLTIDALTLYAGDNGSVASVSPIDSADLPVLNSQTPTATLQLPSDSTVMVRMQTQQVFLVLQYHFGQA